MSRNGAGSATIVIMTTTISLATRDCIVLGCDSLATSVVPAINPIHLADQFFDKSGDLKKDAKGEPVLKNTAQLSAFVTRVPTDQLPNVTKLYHLRPYPVGVTFAGASLIGGHSVKNLIDGFSSKSVQFVGKSPDVTTVHDVAKAFFSYIREIYEKAYAEWRDDLRPHSEVLLSGYSHDSLLPEVYRLSFGGTCECKAEIERGKFNIAYSGQYDVIERVVDGVDLAGYIALTDRAATILARYKAHLEQHLSAELGKPITLPEADANDAKLHLFGEKFGGVKGLKANVGSLSEQAAINFVEFLIDTMIKAQQFSGSIPTVGGDIHLAIITKAGGFRWLSKEEYVFKGHSVSKHGG